MEPPPNAFFNELEQWVYNQSITSIVFVELRAINSTKVREHWDLIAPICKRKATWREEDRERTRDSKNSPSATGFVISQKEQSIWILTCAHILGPAFDETRPITVNKIEELFTAWITCDHDEQRYLGEEYNNRVYTKATVSDVWCSMDLLLLRVSMDNAKFCQAPHHPLRIAAHAPAPLERVVMLSWPPLRNRTAAVGEMSHRDREHNNLSRENRRGYNMLLFEVSIASDFGSSGAPLINGAGEVTGVMQSGFGGHFSYFISLANIQEAMQRFGFED